MTADQSGGQVIQAWNEHRPYLVDLAFRMLGDIGAAEDVVQDAFARMLRVTPGEIADERGWLIVVTSRLCLDQIRSARARRERPHDAGEIEFVPGDPALRQEPGRQDPGDPADRVTLDDNVRLALLVVMERLSPAERVVFVLHDIFQVPFSSIAQTVGRAEPTCRQLARRARQKIAASQGGGAFGDGASQQGGGAFGVRASEHRQVTEKFIAACAGGDLDGLLQVLAPDVWGEFDGGPDDPRSHLVTHGADLVARRLLYFWGPGTTLVTAPAADQPALLGFAGRELAGVLVFTMRAGKIQAVQVIGDPRQLAFVRSQLP